jgi:RNA polymerase sigma-70 factor (ECF subfamily)
MRAPWHALHSNLLRTSDTLSFQQRFRRIREASDALRRFPDPAAVLDHLHAQDGDAAEKNAILAALLEAAQDSGDCGQTADVLLLLALWPGLDAIYRRLVRHFRGDPEALVSEISCRMALGIRRLDPGRVTWIAATLIRNTERDIRRGLRAAWADQAQRGPLPEDLARPDPPSPLALPEGIAPEAAAGLVADRLRPIVGADAVLVAAVAILGERQQEAAARLGLSHEAGRKRYRRALERLRPAFAEFS